MIAATATSDGAVVNRCGRQRQVVKVSTSDRGWDCLNPEG